ncbi:hypothetical protein B0H10DRAFT_1963152 [Mycena sp. CBHHK59/15]|nr:hypothetical protein B0H10DRAFT_1963152 [Mycena sp. CBHHK59/15]
MSSTPRRYHNQSQTAVLEKKAIEERSQIARSRRSQHPSSSPSCRSATLPHEALPIDGVSTGETSPRLANLRSSSGGSSPRMTAYSKEEMPRISPARRRLAAGERETRAPDRVDEVDQVVAFLGQDPDQVFSPSEKPASGYRQVSYGIVLSQKYREVSRISLGVTLPQHSMSSIAIR